jgi:hypothetical protein
MMILVSWPPLETWLSLLGLLQASTALWLITLLASHLVKRCRLAVCQYGIREVLQTLMIFLMGFQAVYIVHLEEWMNHIGLLSTMVSWAAVTTKCSGNDPPYSQPGGDPREEATGMRLEQMGPRQEMVRTKTAVENEPRDLKMVLAWAQAPDQEMRPSLVLGQGQPRQLALLESAIVEGLDMDVTPGKSVWHLMKLACSQSIEQWLWLIGTLQITTISRPGF